MNALTQNLLISCFRSYYLESSLEPPPGLDSREWGFLFFDDSGMRRHKSFFSRGELVDYVRAMVPRHIYHSAAYYQRPGAPTMKEKIWKGADLIFDAVGGPLFEACLESLAQRGRQIAIASAGNLYSQRLFTRGIAVVPGTALAMAEPIARALKRDLDSAGVCGRKGIVGERTKQEIGLLSIRAGDIEKWLSETRS